MATETIIEELARKGKLTAGIQYPRFDIHHILEKIYEQREEIITAFLAKYGLDPAECEQIIETGRDGETIWHVRKREKYETSPR
jgi:hypothetical protein